jgi:DNA replication protein DnaC
MDLHLWGLVSNWEKLGTQPWVPQLLEAEEAERKKRSLERRIQNAHLGPFRSMTNFDWNWPRKINRELIEEIFTLETLKKPINIVLIGPNGVGKTMIAMNLAYQALLRGATVCFTTGSAMLNDLASQHSGTALQRRLKRYVNPSLLVIDEVGYLSYDNRHADLLFEVVSRRYQHLPIILTTNRVFEEWSEVFPNAACVVTMVDRLVHQAEIVEIDGQSYRLKEAKERASKRSAERNVQKAQTRKKNDK